MEVPEPGKRADEAEMLSRITGSAPLDGGAKIVMIPLQTSQPGEDLAVTPCICQFREIQEVGEVSGQGGV